MAEYKIIRVHPIGVSPSNIDVLDKYLNDGYSLIRVDQTQGEARSGNIITSNDYVLRKASSAENALRKCLNS